MISENPNIGKKYPEIDSEIFGFLAHKHIIFYRILNLQEIEIECHPEINEECNLIERKSIKRYQEILDTKGVKELNKIYTDLCNSNSMGAIPNIVAIQVVLFNNDIELK